MRSLKARDFPNPVRPAPSQRSPESQRACQINAIKMACHLIRSCNLAIGSARISWNPVFKGNGAAFHFFKSHALGNL
jgi:hypothetical protein